MCSASKPKLNKPRPVLPDPPPEEAEVQMGGDAEETKKRRRKAALGTRQLTISTTGTGVSGNSGLGIP